LTGDGVNPIAARVNLEYFAKVFGVEAAR